MSVGNVRQLLLNTLKDLEKDDFLEFRNKLTERAKKQLIRLSEVETKTRLQIVKLMISRFKEDGAVRRTIRTLKGIGCNNEAHKLESQYKPAPRANVKKDLPPARDPSPTPRRRSNRGNKSPPGPKRGTKVTAKAQNSPPSGDEKLLFGQHRGRTFRWVQWNDPRYVTWLLDCHRNDKENGKEIAFRENKDALARYQSHFFDKEGLDPVGFGKYKKETRQDLYRSEDEEKKGYVDWIRSNVKEAGGAQMEAMLKYVLYQDKMAAVCPSKAGC